MDFFPKGGKSLNTCKTVFDFLVYNIALNKNILRTGSKPVCNRFHKVIQTKQIDKLNSIDTSEIYKMQLNISLWWIMIFCSV